MKYKNLQTGDVVSLMGTRSVILAIEKPHPDFPGFWLFVWYIFDEKRLSFDALSPEYSLIPGSTVVNDGRVSWRQAIREVCV